jgi:hypothetical protein
VFFFAGLVSWMQPNISWSNPIVSWLYPIIHKFAWLWRNLHQNHHH